MELRLATVDDAKAYKKLRNAKDTYHWFYSQKKFSTRQVREWLKTRDITVDRVYMVEEEGKTVGTCSLYNIHDGEHAEVGRIVVSSEARGQGLGTRILIEVIRVAKELGIRRLYAHIKADNKSSQRAFEKAGFALTMDRIMAVKHL